jgi:hypothetical protein
VEKMIEYGLLTSKGAGAPLDLNSIVNSVIGIFMHNQTLVLALAAFVLLAILVRPKS